MVEARSMSYLDLDDPTSRAWRHELPRLFRWVEPTTLQPGTVAVWQEEENILLINKEVYEELNADERRSVLQCHTQMTLA
jgi:hypothetical protein